MKKIEMSIKELKERITELAEDEQAQIKGGSIIIDDILIG